MKQVIVKVMQDDIDAGLPGKCHKCPVALALARTFELEEGDVGAGYFGLTVGPTWYGTPQTVKKFMRAFDLFGMTLTNHLNERPGKPKPFEFVLNVE